MEELYQNGVKKIISTSIIFLILFFSSQVVLSSFNNIIKSHHDYDDNIAKIILTLNTTLILMLNPMWRITWHR